MKKYQGIKAAAGMTKGLTGRYGRLKVQISYDIADDRVYAYEVANNSQVMFEDPRIVYIDTVDSPMTMQALKDLIDQELSHREAEASHMEL